MDYLQLTLKTVHLIGLVVWFAGLFYLGRLFVYHREAWAREDASQQELLTAQFALMERRLWKAITVPGMVVTLAAGLGLIHYHWGPQGLPAWLHPKLALVALLVIYHQLCGRIRLRLERAPHPWSDQAFRLFNEVPTLLLIGIVSIAVFRQLVSLPVLAGVIVGTIVLIMITVRIYARIRAGSPAA